MKISELLTNLGGSLTISYCNNNDYELRDFLKGLKLDPTTKSRLKAKIQSGDLFTKTLINQSIPHPPQHYIDIITNSIVSG